MDVSIGTRVRRVLAGVAAFLATLHHAAAGPALLTEPATGLVLYAEDADLPWRPASLTKLMTAYLTFEAIRDGQLSPEDVVISTTLSQSQPPSKLGMPLGAQLTVDLAIKALIVKSANDVAIMLAEKVGYAEAPRGRRAGNPLCAKPQLTAAALTRNLAERL